MNAAILDSRQLLAFVTVARRGSFTLAAKDLFLTQSAVSHAIKALEDELGHRMLDRVGKRVSLTQAGEQLLVHAQRILGEMDSARAGLEHLTNWGHGRLRVGASVTACQYLLPSALREFRQSFPKCVIRIEPGDHLRQQELLREGQIDLAVMLRPEGDREFTFVPMFDDQLCFVVSPLHPWAGMPQVPRAQVAQETLILYNKSSLTFRLLADYFREERVTLSNYIELGAMEAIKELAKTGVGVGVTAPWVARAEIAAGSLVAVPLGVRPLVRQWGVGHLRGRRLALGEETFMNLCQEVARQVQVNNPVPLSA
jgi:DNA-binding transcriptional LysR family regulator